MTKKNLRSALTRASKVSKLASASAEAANDTPGIPAQSAEALAQTPQPKRKPTRFHDVKQVASAAVQQFIMTHREPPPDFWYEEGGQLVGYATASAQQPSVLCHKPIAVVGVLVAPDTGQTVARLRYLDLTDTERELHMPLSALASRTADVIMQLATAGVPVADLNLQRCLMAEAARAELPRFTMLRSLGFAFAFDASDPDRIAFAEPNRVLVPRGAPGATTQNVQGEEGEPELTEAASLAFYVEGANAQLQPYGQHGTLRDWTNVVRNAQGNPLLIFGLCVAFGGIINPLHGGEGAIQHVFGDSSTGKTTALQLCGSVFGIAGDPIRSSAPTVVGGWGMSANGMEAQAGIFSGTCKPQDELGGLLSALDVYGAVGGTGKVRMTRDLGAAPVSRWKMYALSSGEKSTEQHVRDTLRRPMKAGEKVRAYDISANAMMQDCELSADERRSRTEAIKVGLEACGGSAAPAYAQWLMNTYPGATTLRAHTRSVVDEANEALLAELEQGARPLASHERRTVRHFAGILAGAWLAVDAGVLPFTNDEVSDAVLIAARAWAEQNSAPDEAESVCRAMREYVLRHRGEMRDTDQDKGDPRQSFGLRHKGLVLLTNRQFEDACGTLNPHHAKRALRDLGILKHEHGKFSLRVNVQELGLVQAQFIALRHDRLFDQSEPPTVDQVMATAELHDGDTHRPDAHDAAVEAGLDLLREDAA